LIIDSIKIVFENNLEDEKMYKLLKPNGFSPDTLKAALFFIAKYYKKINDQELSVVFEDCLMDSFKFAGTANYCPVIVGSIFGVIIKIKKRRLLEKQT
jgi:hypothetical protein